jgi:hypothetical protein
VQDLGRPQDSIPAGAKERGTLPPFYDLPFSFIFLGLWLQESSSSHWHILSSLAGGEATHSFRNKY